MLEMYVCLSIKQINFEAGVFNESGWFINNIVCYQKPIRVEMCNARSQLLIIQCKLIG